MQIVVTIGRYSRPVFGKTLVQQLIASIMAEKSMGIQFPVDLKRAADLYKWNKQFFSIGGMWPLEPTFFKFYTSYAYFISHVILLIADFVSVFGCVPLMIANLLETFMELMIGVKMMLLRHSSPLRRIIQEILTDLHEDNYRDETEKKLYIEYNEIGKSFFKIGGYMGFFTCVFYHLKPLEDVLRAVLRNETIPFNLPYRMRLFFNITDTRTYALVYLSQTPVFYYYYCHAMSVLFLCTLTVHAAGQMTILGYRIRHINALDTMKGYRQLESALRDIVEKHRKIILFVTEINNVFNIVLLEELSISTLLIGLTSYSVLANLDLVSVTEFFFLALYTTTTILLIFVYCINGEYLIQESTNIRNACYECEWYEMPPKHQKNLMICMTRVAKPLQLTAGRFYIFSLSQFSGVLKTSVAYISMLRAVV